jgi:23S rRNA (cytidine2498-2'-O)-methyltransferase
MARRERQAPAGRTKLAPTAGPLELPPTPARWSAYQLIPGLEGHLEEELVGVFGRWGPMLLAEGPPQAARWALNVWPDPERVAVGSISEAARALRARGLRWWPLSLCHHRRVALIQEQLPRVSVGPHHFPSAWRPRPLGAWSLLPSGELLCAAGALSPLPNGELRFEEDREGPPSRAYLKLWEALLRWGRWPKAGERALDVGACPGGWTWALLELGAEVTAVDRAPLDPRLLGHPRLRALEGDAFRWGPERWEGQLNWLCSDLICYPARLLDFVEPWAASGRVDHMVCTIKLQGEGWQGLLPRFEAIPGASVLHLWHNKHELTWLWRRAEPTPDPDRGGPHPGVQSSQTRESEVPDAEGGSLCR